MLQSENPLPVEEDPIKELLEFDVASATTEELNAHLEKLKKVSNDPREFRVLLSGKARKQSKGKSTKARLEDAAIQALMDEL